MKLVIKSHFDAAHKLENLNLSREKNLELYGKCFKSMHGHRWIVEVEIEAPIDVTTGMIVNFVTIKNTIQEFDHRVVNDILGPDKVATAENVCVYLLDKIKREVSADSILIRVYESPDCYVEDKWTKE